MSSSCSTWGYEVYEGAPLSLTARRLKSILESKACEITLGGIIVLHIVMITLETDANANDKTAATWIAGTNYTIVIIYISELLAKLFVYRLRFFSDSWNLMDLLVVGSDVVMTCLDFVYRDMPKVAVLRAARLVRLALMFKSALSFPERAMILPGFVKAFKAMIWGVVLILLMLTVWSILAVQLIQPLNKDVGSTGVYGDCKRCPRAFDTVFISMLTLAGDSWGTVALPIIEAYPVSGLFFLAVLVTISLAILNLILAVILESAQDALSEANLDQAVKEDKEHEEARKQFLTLFARMDTEHKGTLSKAALMKGFEDANVRAIIRTLDFKRTEIENLIDVMMDEVTGSIDYAEFVYFFTRSRAPSNHTMLLEFAKMQHRVERQLKQLGQDVSGIPSRIGPQPVPEQTDTAQRGATAVFSVEESPEVPPENHSAVSEVIPAANLKPVVEFPNVIHDVGRDPTMTSASQDRHDKEVCMASDRVSLASREDFYGLEAFEDRSPTRGQSEPSSHGLDFFAKGSRHSTFELWQSWTHGKTSGSIQTRDILQADSALDAAEDYDDNSDSEEEVFLETTREIVVKSWWVANPSSKRRVQWDMLGIMVLSYDLVMIPFIFAFDPKETLASKVLNFLVLIFWTLDILASFCCGYFDKVGKLEMDGHRVALNYLRSWCVMDIIIVSVDWLLIALNGHRTGASSFMRIGKLLRAVRVLRALRLLRLVKFKTLLSQIQDRIDSEFLAIGLGVVKLMLIIVAINHAIACLWFKLGNYQFDGYESWVTHYEFGNLSMDNQYLSSLHWSLTQFTPASINVHPVNKYERTFAVCVLLFAMIVFSSFVSSITAAMNQLRNLSAKNGSQMWLLRKYLREQGVPPDLYVRLVRYVSVTAERITKKVQKSDVKFLGLLSAPLTMELTTSLCQPHIITHPFFARLGRRCKGMMHKLCCWATKPMAFSRGDVLFHTGEEAVGMYFVTQGYFWYSHVGRTDRQLPPNKCGADPVTVKIGTWFSEAVLWVPWHHCGKMRAGRESDVILIEANKFRDLALLHPAQVSWIRQTGQNFAFRLNSDADKVSDVLEWTADIGRASGTCSDFSDAMRNLTDVNPATSV